MIKLLPVRAAKAIGLASVFALIGCNPVIGPADALFEDVRASGEYEDAGLIELHFAALSAVPRYLIVRDRLYLLTQVTQPHRLNIIVVEMPQWRVPEVTALLQKHLELRRYAVKGRWIRIP